MIKNKINEIILLLIFPIIFLLIVIPRIVNTLEERRKEEFVYISKLILLNVENEYLNNKLNGNSNVITCDGIDNYNNTYDYCSIYIENDKINLTLHGKGLFKNMNICSKSKDSIKINNSCDDICFKTNIYDVKKPYEIYDYDSCIVNAKDIFLNSLSYKTKDLEEFCRGNSIENYIAKIIQIGYDEEFLVNNKIINGRVNNVCVPNEFKSSCYTFKIYTENKRNYAEVINYDDSCGNVVSIPSQILGVDVEGIGEYAFSGKSVNTVSFPNTIKYIKTGAFQGHGDGINSNLRGVFLSGELDLRNMNKLEYIDYFAFADNNITKLRLPNSIKAIESYSFSGNKIKGELDLSNTKLTRINSYSFSGSNISNILLPLSVKSIGYTAFAGNNIKELDLSKNINITDIEQDAFADNDIINIKLPVSLKEIKQMAFFNNKIKDLDLSTNNNLKLIGENAFKNNVIESVILPVNIEKIDTGAFFKNEESNYGLSSIINLSEKEFDWNNILGYKSDIPFDYGIINNEIEIKKP